MSWTEVYNRQWCGLAAAFKWTPDQIRALTLDEFTQALEFVKGG